MLSIDGQTYDPGRYDAVRSWVRDTFAAAQRLGGAGGAFLSFSGDQPTDRAVVEQQFGGNLDRLRSVKRRYDPDNLFRVNHNITPAR